MDSFYADYFSRPKPKPLSPAEQWKRHTDYLRGLATSEWGTALKEKFHLQEIDEAESAWAEVLKKIDDPELRNELDMAAGKISQAYEILGFCAGNFSQDSRAQAL